MILESLSDIELYFTRNINYDEQKFFLINDEFHHAVKVMRSKEKDFIFATDGKGKIFKGITLKIENKTLTASIVDVSNYQNKFEKIIFWIPNLKNPERLKFAVEKCTELGITNLKVYNSDRTINKPFNLGRLNSIAIAAMKQSLRAFAPSIEYVPSLKSFKFEYGIKILFDQHAESELIEFSFQSDKEYHFIFGPEGSFTDFEESKINPDANFNLGKYRLRSETAILKAASIISKNV